MRVVRYYPRALDGDGGMTGAVCSAARALSVLAEQVSVVYDAESDRDPGPSTERLTWRAVRHTGLGGLRVPVGLDELLEEADLLVLHSGWTAHNLAAAREARRMRVPYLLEPRGAYDPHIVARRRSAKALWWRAGERRMVEQALAVHVFFGSERAHLAELGYSGAIVAAPNGVRLQSDFCWDGGSGGYLLWLGRFDPEHKGLDILLNAMSVLGKQHRPQLRLHGPDWRNRKGRVAEMVNAMGLDEWVRIGDAVYGRDKFDLLSRASGFVYPSRWEAFGNSVAEAAALGVPVLTTTYPLGLYLAERSAGVAKQPEPAALATGISEITGPTSARMGSNARRVAAEELSWDAVVRSWLSQVEQLLRPIVNRASFCI